MNEYINKLNEYGVVYKINRFNINNEKAIIIDINFDKINCNDKIKNKMLYIQLCNLPLSVYFCKVIVG